jgi:ketosteroid isomerase-like protein
MDNASQIREILQTWAENTRTGNLNAVLANHAPNLLIYDVLPPMKYESAAAYRASWGDWQPENVGEAVFALRDLVITAGSDVAFAHAFIHCAGTTPTGKKYEDLVRATFCLTKTNGAWRITHQHISKPRGT